MKGGTRRKDRRAPEAGFTLLETIVALLILALALGTAVQSVALASSRLGMSDHARDIEEVARRTLASLAATPPRPGRTEGVDRNSGLHWVIEARAVPGLETQSASHIVLTLTSGTIRRLRHRFETMVLGQADT
ncbi:prepilin-type N-terminal cleavage/methylation domain-containing protein [Oricola cellulosilytica]|uniref:Prepilin-type N-terminal cleavage/methylation domain-containing protein n=1 Tax=Oricola cellulosilytica TaxID=1429082 RepID=A0A4R0PFP1_9HYPH|nr:prepilin-type N-terminal cleavage/methylation domain-containing protein [Oricola cellulosilytica]TCD16665.1 prepilin-type N-terminal cleavage/methylation domain-containing protein [Oricola cellulosilytica]